MAAMNRFEFERAYALFQLATGAPNNVRPRLMDIELVDRGEEIVIDGVDRQTWSDILLMNVMTCLHYVGIAWHFNTLVLVADSEGGRGVCLADVRNLKNLVTTLYSKKDVIEANERHGLLVDGRVLGKYFEESMQRGGVLVQKNCRAMTGNAVDQIDGVCVGFDAERNAAIVSLSQSLLDQLDDEECNEVVSTINLVRGGAWMAHVMFFAVSKRLKVITLFDSNSNEAANTEYLYSELGLIFLGLINEYSHDTYVVRMAEGMACQSKSVEHMRNTCFLWPVIGADLCAKWGAEKAEEVLRVISAFVGEENVFDLGRGGAERCHGK